MFRSIFCALMLCLATAVLGAQTMVIGKTPQQKPDYAQGVSGHAATLLKVGKQDVLLMLGGCNFPNEPAVNGGEKRYYAEVYSTVYKHGVKIKAWQQIGRLPSPFAYAAYQKYNNTLIIAGGKSTREDLSTAYRLSLGSQGKLKIDTLPNLPAPRSGMASAVIGSRLYLIGGAVEGKLSNTMISLDLENIGAGWREEQAYPGKPRLKVLATATSYEDKGVGISCFASYSNVETDEPIESDFALMTYYPEKGEWDQESLADNPEFYEGYTFGGGCIYFNQIDETITLVGGVRSTRFMPALQREQHMRIAKREGDHEYLEKLKGEAKVYLSQKPEWYEFCPVYFFVTPIYGTGSSSLEPSQHLAKADAALVEIKPYHWILLGGEIKPGIRTADICY